MVAMSNVKMVSRFEQTQTKRRRTTTQDEFSPTGWECTQSISGSRCDRALAIPSFEQGAESKTWFPTKRQCQDSNCFRAWPQPLLSSDLVDLMGQYLDLESLQTLSKIDPHTLREVEPVLNVALGASELVERLEMSEIQAWRTLTDDLSDADEKSQEYKIARAALGQVIDLAEQSPTFARTVAGRFLDNDRFLLMRARELFPSRYPQLVWSLADRKSVV